jgi:outer membrane protein assembly factor BamE (lipoprotein component of BamABCDE complex)
MKMKKYALICGTFASALMLTGCASVGNESLRKETETSVAQKIVQGKTTKSEVKAMFGSPTKTTFTDGGLEVWNYDFSNVSADAISYVPIVNLFGASASGKKKELVVMYDTSDIVKRFSMSESDVTHKTGLFNN